MSIKQGAWGIEDDLASGSFVLIFDTDYFFDDPPSTTLATPVSNHTLTRRYSGDEVLASSLPPGKVRVEACVDLPSNTNLYSHVTPTTPTNGIRMHVIYYVRYSFIFWCTAIVYYSRLDTSASADLI
jgi:hypothetical protein